MSQQSSNQDIINTMTQGTANQNAAGIRRICKRFDEPAAFSFAVSCIIALSIFFWGGGGGGESFLVC